MFPNRYVLFATTCIACDGMGVSHELLKPNYKNKLIELSIKKNELIRESNT